MHCNKLVLTEFVSINGWSESVHVPNVKNMYRQTNTRLENYFRILDTVAIFIIIHYHGHGQYFVHVWPSNIRHDANIHVFNLM